MSRRTSAAAALVALGLAVGAAGTAAGSGAAPVPGFGARLAAMVRSGQVEPARADLYRLYAVRAPDRLPPDLRAGPETGRQGERAAAARPSLRCGTPILRAVRARLGRMPPEMRAEAEALLDPPRPPARRTTWVAGKSVTHVLPNWIETPNFSVEWGPELTNEDGSLPLRDDDADPDDPAVGGNGIPDVVERWAAYFEASFREEMDRRGFTHPAIEGNLIPVYLGNSDPTTTIDDIGSGTYAWTQDVALPYIVVNNDLRFVPANGAGSSGMEKIRGAMRITAAHELFHVVHFLYEPPAWVPDEDDWWFETSSTWMEDEVFDSVNDYYQYFRPDGWPAFVEAGLPVPFTDRDYTMRAYGSVIFAKYLSEHVGGDTALSEIWSRIRPDPDTGYPGARVLPAVDAYAADHGFSGLGELFLGFAAANAVMDYEEGIHYGVVPVRNADSSLSHDSAADGLPVPAYLGATYLARDTGTGGGLRVSLSGQPAATWGLALLVDREGAEPLALGALGSAGTAAVTLAGLGTGDAAYGVPAYLDPAGPSTSYVLAEEAAAPGDAVAPGPVTGLAVTAAPGGFDASWAAPADPDVAGYVVRWSWGSRTLFGPVTSVRVRGLPPGTYDVSVYAYDAAGNADRDGAASREVAVTEAGADAEVVPAEILGSHIDPGGAGGGGGGGCFLRALGAGAGWFLDSQAPGWVE